MREKKNILNIAKSVISDESIAIDKLKNQITDDFVHAVNLIFKSNGRLIVAGIGKSANIANKIVATFNSTGQPSVFLHAADALHGDLGNIQQDDIVICISKSGNTEEIKYLLPIIKKLGNKVISLCGNPDSYLAKESDYFLDCSVEKEACPNNLAPTSSTTAQLVIGDALAVCLLEMNNFTDIDFARFHPGGSLGKRLYLRVSDLLHNSSSPKVTSDDSITSVILEISNKRLGATSVIDNGRLVGIITDGDLRRMLEKNQDIKAIKAADIMTLDPKVTSKETLAMHALNIMESHSISHLIVMDNQLFCGIIHIHDILKEGI